jgi:preprotein translocase subunit SecE
MNIVQKPVIFLIRFLKEVRIEMKKVSWLSRREVLNYTAVVILVSAVAGVYLGALDFAFSELVRILLTRS